MKENTYVSPTGKPIEPPVSIAIYSIEISRFFFLE